MSDANIELPEDVKQRFPSLRYWTARLRQELAERGATDRQELEAKIAGLESEINALKEIIRDLEALVTSRRKPTDVSGVMFWLGTRHPSAPSGLAIDELTDGYVKHQLGVPETVAQIPDEDIEYTGIDLDTDTEIDWSLGRVFYKELSGDTNMTFANTVSAKQIMVVIKQDSSTAYQCTFSGVKWAGGNAPDLTLCSPGSYNVFAFLKSPTTGDIIGTALCDAQ